MPYVEYDEVEAVCSDCGRTFRSEEALEAHRLDAHPPGNPATEPVAHPRREPVRVRRKVHPANP